MSIEKITAKIEGDARAIADQIIGEAKNNAWDIVQAAEKRAKKIIADAEARGVQDRDKQVVSRKAVAVIDGKNVTLSYKQKMIDQCFADAIEKVTSMEKGPYMDFLAGLAKVSGASGGEVILSEKDQALGEELVARLNKEIPEGAFSLSKETKPIAGGLVIRSGSSYYNASVDAIVSEFRDEMTSEIASVLFDSKEN